MIRAQTYYELLGISRTASASDIRAAYVRMMKHHHPDAAGGVGASGESDLVRAINRGYAILRDPVQRIAYDAQLARWEHGPSSTFRPQQVPAVNSARSVWGPTALLLSGLLIAGVIVALEPAAERTSKEFLAGLVGWSSRTGSDGSQELTAAFPNQSEVRRLAQLARTVSVGQAVLFSHDCFHEASRQASATAAELCVIFDVAFLYWRKAPRPISDLPVHFSDEVVMNRHSDALRSFGAGSQRRLSELRQRAFLALVDDLRASNAALEKAAAAASISAESVEEARDPGALLEQTVP